MSIVTTDEILELLETDLTDLALQGVIDREEAWLASRIGQLEGERTVVVWPAGYGPVHLSRPADTVEVLDAHNPAVAVPGLKRRPALHPPPHTAGPAPISITSTPTDEEVVRGAVIELVALALTYGGSLVSERHGAHSIQRFQTAGAYAELREDVLRRVRPEPRMGAARVRSTDRSRITPANGEPTPVTGS